MRSKVECVIFDLDGISIQWDPQTDILILHSRSND